MVSCREFPSNHVCSLHTDVNSHSPGYISQAISSIMYIPSNWVIDSQNVPLLKLSTIFCYVLSGTR